MAPETHDQPEHTIVVRSSSDRRNRKVTPAAFRQRVRKYLVRTPHVHFSVVERAAICFWNAL